MLLVGVDLLVDLSQVAVELRLDAGTRVLCRHPLRKLRAPELDLGPL